MKGIWFRKALSYIKRGFLVVRYNLKEYFRLGIVLIRAESPEEQARAQKVLAGAIIGGAIMVVAPSIASYLGLSYSNAPKDVRQMFDRLITLLRAIGAFVLIAGVIYGGIQLLVRKK